MGLSSAIRCQVVETPADWMWASAIRFAVFVNEQRVPFDEELDEHDRDAFHVLTWLGDRPVGTGRLVTEGDTGRIGRMAVLPAARGAGVGSAVLRALLAEAERRGLRSVHLAAQLHARPFYARFGFVAGGPHFLDAGIWHQRMERMVIPWDTPTPPP
ncbi:MAG TPA: GNAT family N-acetyltransferase [Chloroflexota bacterium]|nr:GNAT family N-acetyltransferase [Chloroflexota bacterium]